MLYPQICSLHELWNGARCHYTVVQYIIQNNGGETTSSAALPSSVRLDAQYSSIKESGSSKSVKPFQKHVSLSEILPGNFLWKRTQSHYLQDSVGYIYVSRQPNTTHTVILHEYHCTMPVHYKSGWCYSYMVVLEHSNSDRSTQKTNHNSVIHRSRLTLHGKFNVLPRVCHHFKSEVPSRLCVPWFRGLGRDADHTTFNLK